MSIFMNLILGLIKCFRPYKKSPPAHQEGIHYMIILKTEDHEHEVAGVIWLDLIVPYN